MQVLIKKWGNSASVRLPAAIMEAAKLSLGQPVDVRAEGGRVIVEPVRTSDIDLNALLARVTDVNIHAEVETGRPVGKERL